MNKGVNAAGGGYGKVIQPKVGWTWRRPKNLGVWVKFLRLENGNDLVATDKEPK